MAEGRRDDLALGIDLGGTKILAGVVEGRGKILGRGKLKTPFAGSERALEEALVAAADAALSEAGQSRGSVGSLGVAAPGPLDTRRGLILRAGNLAVKNFEILARLGKAFPKARRRLENDVRLAAYGEAHLGAGRGAPLVVAVWVGTGIGGAVIWNGRIHTGRNRNAGELGQMQIDIRKAEPGRTDTTLEGIASKVGITRYLAREVKRGKRTLLKKVVRRKDERLKGSDLKEAWEAGDRLTRKAVARSALAVGMSMANIFDLLAPDLFVLGGGVAQDLGKPYLSQVRRWAEAFAFTTELGGIRIEPSALGDDAGLLGAALFSRAD